MLASAISASNLAGLRLLSTCRREEDGVAEGEDFFEGGGADGHRKPE